MNLRRSTRPGGRTDQEVEGHRRAEDQRVLLAGKRAQQSREVFLNNLSRCERVTVERWKARATWAHCQEFAASFQQEQA
jgi:hypothetical protein